jgi:Tyrosine phosphatase family
MAARFISLAAFRFIRNFQDFRMNTRSRLSLLLAVLVCCPAVLLAQSTLPAPQTAAQKPGEKFPSDDALISDFHNLGEINGTTNLFRSASPLRDLEKKGEKPADDAAAQARARLQHLYDLGIRTIVSFEQPNPPAGAGKEDKTNWIALEQAAAKDVGIAYVSHPMANSGKDSLETLAPAAVLVWLQAVDADVFKYAKGGGVDVHCSAGHDRTGIVVAYLRMKYQHWTAEAAIQEMRDRGHNWPKYSANGGISSWHEADVRAVAQMLNASAGTQPSVIP